jgi:hypothetical protein
LFSLSKLSVWWLRPGIQVGILVLGQVTESFGGCTVNRPCRLGSPTATVGPLVYVKTAGPFLRVVPASLIRVNVWKLNTVQK